MPLFRLIVVALYRLLLLIVRVLFWLIGFLAVILAASWNVFWEFVQKSFDGMCWGFGLIFGAYLALQLLGLM